MSGPIGAGAGPAVPPKKVFRDPTPAENRELSRLLDWSTFRPKRILQWFRQHPTVRGDSFANGNTEYINTPLGRLLSFGDGMTPTHPVIQELMSRDVDFEKKDENGRTLLQFMDYEIEGSDMMFERGYTAREPGDRKRKLRDFIRKRMTAPLAEIRMADSVARQKNLPPDVGDLIASQLSGKSGTIQEQRATLKKSAGIPGGRRRRTRRR